ncbi:ABC transporter ATP-binding protein [Candidatus Woesearchaeota archaeon]|nr:MAG: ABC transporter ATP-binding protein [Candidatus Woesearchaeota archaeon]
MILSIDKLNAWYGKLQVLHDIDMHFNTGEIVSIIGPNGAGKSTVLKSIFNLIKKKGRIIYKNKNITKYTPQQIAKAGITYVPQGRSVFTDLTVHENIEIGAFIKPGNPWKDFKRVYTMFPNLKDLKNTRAGLLSGGEQQMTAIARALMLKPRVLLLDEPTLGLSPKVRTLIFDKIIEINKTGVTIIMVEQNAKRSLEISNRAYVLEICRNKYSGRGKQLLEDQRIKKLYLGGK